MTLRFSLIVLAALGAAVKGNAQDMVGPSTDPDRVPPPPPAEAPEPAATEPADPAPVYEGEAPVIRPQNGVTSPAEGAVEVEPTVEGPPAAAPDEVATDVVDGAEPAADGDAAETDTAAEGDEAADFDELYFARWQQQMAAGDFPGAAGSADDWVRETIRRHGDEAIDLIGPLQFAAVAWAETGDHARAEQAYRRVVAIAETRLGVFHSLLVEPLTGLGRALIAQGNDEAAASALLRAQNITHRNLGIFNLEQQPISRELVEAWVNMGEITRANREQRFVFGANEKVYGKASPELVPALHRWAHWNAQLGRFSDARRHYRRALSILEDSYGAQDLRLVETLHKMARSFDYSAQSTFPREGARALERVVEIYRSQAFVDQNDLLREQTRLGDYYMRAGSRSRSIDAYTEAVTTAMDAGMDEDTINMFYGKPQPLQPNNAAIDVLSRRLVNLAGDDHHILVEFSVDARGRARDIRIVEDTVQLVSVARDVRERVMMTAFRPRFENGRPAVTHGVQMLFEFESSGKPGRIRPVPAIVDQSAAGGETTKTDEGSVNAADAQGPD